MLNRLTERLKQPQADGSPSTFYLYSRIYKYIHPHLWRVIISTLITIPIGALDGAVAYSLRPYLDNMEIQHSVQNVSFIPLLIVGITAVQGILQYFSIYLNGWLSVHITSDMRRDLLQKLMLREMRYFDTTTSGTILQRYFKDPEALQQNLLENTKTVLTRFFSSLSLIGVLVMTSWKLSILAVGVLVLILLPSTGIRSLLKQLSKDLTTSGAALMALYNETTTGAKVVHGYQLEKYQLKKFDAIQEGIFNRTMKKVKAQGWLTPSMHLIASIGVALIIWQGSRLVMSEELSTGGLVAFIAALIMLYNPVKNLGASLMNTQVSLLAAGRVCEILDDLPMIQDKPDAKTLKTVRHGIEFDHVWFNYRIQKRREAFERKAALKDFTYTFPVGKTTALVGHSGSGKTTIANLIPRFYEVVDGAIRIDGIDIRDLKQESLRSQIAMVMQDNFLFNGTIRDNIMMGRPTATEAELLDALDKAYLTEFLTGMKLNGDINYGLSREIGERGIMLSGGQRQRVAIARALLKNAPIVILDEATSALDNQSEAIVQQAIESLMKDRTVIVIAHRLSTIRNADNILVMDAGRLIEQGTHEELLALNGVYKGLYDSQFSTTESDNDTNSLTDTEPAEAALLG